MTKVHAISGGNTSVASNIHIILDETGSMMPTRAATISSFNEFINSQKNQSGECFVNLVTFSNKFSFTTAKTETIRRVFKDVSIQDVKELTVNEYKPDGGTNLYDAIGSTIANITDPNPLIVIITDGHDNQSTEYNQANISGIIETKTKEGWTFVYLGANQDAWSVGQKLGLSKGQTMTYDTSDMSGMMSSLSSATSSYRSMRSAGVVGSVDNFFGGKDEK